MIGSALSEDDRNNKSGKYFKLIHVMGNYFRNQSQMFVDILKYWKKQDEVYFKQLMLSLCFDLPKLYKEIMQANIALKKSQRISNSRWQNEVIPAFKYTVNII